MKKLFLITLGIAFMGTSFVKAQETKKFNIALVGSPSVSWMKPGKKTIESEGAKMNLSYGLIFDKNFADNFAFSTGFNVNYSGGKLKETSSMNNLTENDVHSVSVNYKLQHIEIPLMLKMRTNEIGYMTYFANIGLGLGANLKAKGDVVKTNFNGKELDGTADDMDLQTEYNAAYKVNFFRPSFIVGAGATYSLGGNASIFGGINFNNGLMDVLDHDDRSAITNYISLNLGIMF